MRSFRGVVLVLLLVLVASSCRWIVRASVDSAGNQSNGPSYNPALSADGRFVAFESDATNLVPNDTNQDRDVFVRDNRTGAVERAFESARLVDLSEDGRFVAVSARANCGDLGVVGALFIRDRQNDVTDCVYPVGGHQALSATARFVASSIGGASTVSVHDRETGDTESFPVPSDQLFATRLAISDDGRHVAFDTRPVACPPDFPWPSPCPSHGDVFVHDREDGTNERMPLPPPDAVLSSLPSISGDARWVAYQITQRFPEDPFLNVRSVWIYDRHTGSAEPISVRPDGTLAVIHDDRAPSISRDGRFVVFHSSERLDPTSSFLFGSGLYARDVVEQTTTFLNVNALGTPAPEQLSDHAIADDGRYVAFTSRSSNLVANDTNDAFDVFLRAIPTPSVESMTPPSVPRGTSLTISITGSGFAPAPNIRVLGDGVAVTATTRVSEHELSMEVVVDESAPIGTRTVIVKNTGTGPGPTAGDARWCVSCLTIT